MPTLTSTDGRRALVQTLCTMARSCDAAPVRDDASRPKVKALVSAIHASSVSAAKKRQAGDVLHGMLVCFGASESQDCSTMKSHWGIVRDM